MQKESTWNGRHSTTGRLDGSLKEAVRGLMKQEKTGSEKQGMYLKPMPCLKVEGLDLKMYWCCIGEEGETVSWLRSVIVLS